MNAAFRGNTRPLSLALSVALLVGAPAFGEPMTVADHLHALVDATPLKEAHRSVRERHLLRLAYAPTACAPRWLESDRPTTPAWDAIALLRDVGAKGLEPNDYDASFLTSEATRFAAARRPLPPSELARFDLMLSVAIVRLVTDLHLGRVDPRTLGFGYEPGSRSPDLATLVATALVNGRVGDAVRQAEPPLLENRLLEAQLAHYRRLASDSDLVPVRLASPVRPGARLDDAPALARWLRAVGDLSDVTAVAPVYEGELVDAVQRFQIRHGLAPDGVIGTATAAALAVPLAVRVRQIGLALERLRWLPALARDRALIVNVPAFDLLAFDEIGAGRPPALEMAVVVGRALRTETPFFMGAMTNVVFAPYWNVPRSILRNEILPKLRTKPGYLAAEDMEIVSEGRVLAPTADALSRLARGGADLRQRPGPKNALGRVKFLFPNPHHVYMHDTPARELFSRPRRDFSHGCIRLADASALAHWVLAADGWDAARIDQMLAVEHETFVPLRRAIPVVIAYATAAAYPDGTIAFYDDVYGHDAALERALRLAAQR